MCAMGPKKLYSSLYTVVLRINPPKSDRQLEMVGVSEIGVYSPLSKHARRLRESRSKSLLSMDSFQSLSTPAGIQQFLRQKFPMPHYSQLNGGKFELLVVDDDPVNQVRNCFQS